MSDAIDRAAGGYSAQTNEPMVAVKDTSQIPRLADGSMPVEMGPQGGITPVETQPTFAPKPPETAPAQAQDQWQNMQRDYTRKTQELAEQRRQVEEQRRMLDYMLAQQQQMQGLQTQPVAQQQSSGVIKDLLANQWETMAPEAKAVWGTLDKGFEVFAQRMRQEMQSLQPQVDPRALQQLHGEIIDVKAGQGVNALAAQYGDGVLAYGDSIRQLCKQYPGLSAEQALDHLNPSIKQNYLIEQGKRLAIEEMNQRQAAAASNGRQFPSANISSTYVQGESMRDTAARLGVSFDN